MRPLGVREKTAVQQERLDHVLQRLRLLLQRCRQRLDANRAAEVLVHDHIEQAAIQGC